MPSSRHLAYTTALLHRLSVLVADEQNRAQMQLYGEVAEVLLGLDLEPARARLSALLAPASRGGKPRDPVVVWRFILVGLLIGVPAYNRLVRVIRASDVLRALVGLEPGDRGPGVGTLYDFEHRLHDGPWRPRCEHLERPSVTQRRRAESEQPKRETSAAAKRAGRERRPEQTAASVVASIRARAGQPLPFDLDQRVNDLLHLVAVVPSAASGLLGELDKLVLAGDSSVLPTAAAMHGAKSCEDHRFERCDCARRYADPDAALGYDANARTTYFGHRFAEITCGSAGHDLPVVLDLHAANVPDTVSGPLLVERLTKTLATHLPAAKVAVTIFDAGYDAEPLHALLVEQGIDAVIPLKGSAPAHHPARADIALSAKGIPLCKANVEMAPSGTAGPGHKLFTCPLRVGRITACPLGQGDASWHCRPELKTGPTVSVPIDANPRLCPKIARNSEDYARYYPRRTTAERSNAMKKLKFKLLSARRRRRSGWLITLGNIAILQHALAWAARSDEARASLQSLLRREAA